MTLYRSPLPIKAKAIVMVEATPTPLSYMLAMLNPETLRRGGAPHYPRPSTPISWRW